MTFADDLMCGVRATRQAAINLGDVMSLKMRYWVTMFEKRSCRQFRMTSFFATREEAEKLCDRLLKIIEPNMECRVFEEVIPQGESVNSDPVPTWAKTLLTTGKRR